MKKLKAVILAMITILLLACGEQPSEADTLDLSNVLSLDYQKALAKQAYVCPDTAAGVDIDIGCILRSGNNYFVLDNTTDYELTDVAIVSSNPAFVATPAKITNIGVVGKSTGITPMLRVAISHGTELNDMSVPDPLGEGTAKTTLTITGKVNGQEFKQEYVIGGYAKTIRAIRKEGKIYLEGPMYKNGTVQNLLKVSSDFDICDTASDEICVNNCTTEKGEKGYTPIIHNIDFIAPLSTQFHVYEMNLFDDSEIIEK